MKKIIFTTSTVMLSTLFTFNAQAQDPDFTLDETNISGLPRCEDLPDSAMPVDQGYGCIITKTDEERDAATRDFYRDQNLDRSAGGEYQCSQYKLSLDGMTPTALRYRNKGGYVSWMNIEYWVLDENNQAQHIRIRGKHLQVEQLSVHQVPPPAWNVRVEGRLNLFAIDQQSGFIFSRGLGSWDTDYIAEDLSEYRIQINSWGTTFDPKWSFVRPPNSIPVGVNNLCDLSPR